MKQLSIFTGIARLALGIAALGVTACGTEPPVDDNNGSAGSPAGSGGSAGANVGGGSGSGNASGGSAAGALGVGGSAGSIASGGVGTGGGGSGNGGSASGAGTGGQGGVSGSGGSGGAPTGEPRSMGFIGCSMAENVAQGYQALGGMRMWPPYGTGGLVVQSWTDTNSSAWDMFDAQVAENGEPTAVWVQICIFAQNGVDYDEVKQLIANAREHAAPGATIYITGQPLYEQGWTCNLAGATGPQLTDDMAQQAAADGTQNVLYPGAFGPLGEATTADPCHANQAGQALLGQQAIDFFGD